MTPALLSEFAQKRAKQAVMWSKESDTTMKYACIAAAYAGVGEYSHMTEYIAAERLRSPATVLNWSQAFRLYEALRRTGRTDSRRLWRLLSASHWWLAFGIHNGGYDALHYLLVAETNGYSGRDMMAEFRADKDAGQAPMMFDRLKVAIVGAAAELMKQSAHLTPAQNAALDAVADAFGE